MNQEAYLFDITTLITYSSDITNIPNLMDKFKEKYNAKDDMYRQMVDEKNDPVLLKLNEKLKGKKMLMTKLASEKTKEIINNLGNEDEKKRMEDLLKQMTIIDDDPSERFKKLNGKMWSLLNINTFGTADKHKITLVTGNVKAASFISNEFDPEPDMIVHRSRCFVGDKLKKLSPANILFFEKRY
ncbi:MAG: hypothetical protein Edafosvirus14_26 [Edafosvirus sp.]|uniref:DUF1308 domain-containing protein n=1 Tax=Edafosvirus sp. TaxID=2487765 RepID=A0A3G4ZYJ4_9VIRU|nr:MAG: hypothetical protein Edafosvirus14_26 [Edafosvirus sp.]